MNTFEENGNLAAIVDERGQAAQVVLFGQRTVVDFYKTDAQLVRLVVNVFQFLQSLGAPFAFRLVCMRAQYIRRIVWFSILF